MTSQASVTTARAEAGAPITGHSLFEQIQAGLGTEARRHRGVDPPARRDTALAGGSYRAIGSLVDGFRAGDGDVDVTGIVVAARASTAVLHRAVDLGANLIISRTAFLGDSQDRPVSRPEPALAAKIDYISANRLAVLRLQDPRVGEAGRAIVEAYGAGIGLGKPLPTDDPAAGLFYRPAPTTVLEIVRRTKQLLPTETVRLVGDPMLQVAGIAVATETNRPNALAPLLSHEDVELVICGEVHETETTAYMIDALALGQRKALLIVGSIAIEEPAARALASWLQTITPKPVTYVPSGEGLIEIT
jgi:hypothetical protein